MLTPRVVSAMSSLSWSNWLRRASYRFSLPRRAQFLHKLEEMSLRERRQLANTIMLLAGVRLGLSVLPFRSVSPCAASTPRRRRLLDPKTPARVARAIRIGSRFVPGASCLTQAVAARILMHREGHPCEIRIGVAKGDGQFRAHAWLESGGAVIVGGEVMAEFTPLPILSTQSSRPHFSGPAA